MNDINKGGEYRQYVINIYSNQSEKSAREGLMSFASEQGFEISDVENALQVYKYDTEENAFGENYYTKVAIANMIDMISGKYAKGTTIKFDKLPKNRQADKNYDYFAVGKIDGKIVDGWEIVDDVESLKYYAKIDLKDNDYNPKNFNIVSAKYLIRKGINPFDYNNWRKIDYSTNESAYATKFLEGEIYANGGGVGMNDSKRLENFIKKYNDTARKSGMYGFSKGDLMKMAYGDNYTNVDSALPMGLLREMRIDEADNYFYVMDYNNNSSFGELTNLFDKIAQKNPTIEIYNEMYEKTDTLPIMIAVKKYNNEEVLFQVKRFDNSGMMANGGGIKNLDKIKISIGDTVYNHIDSLNKEQLEKQLSELKQEIQRELDNSGKSQQYFKYKDEEFFILYRLERGSEFKYANGGGIYFKKYSTIKGGVKNYSVDIDLENGEQLRGGDLDFKDGNDALFLYKRVKQKGEYQNEKIEDIQLIVNFKNGDYETVDIPTYAKGTTIEEFNYNPKIDYLSEYHLLPKKVQDIIFKEEYEDSTYESNNKLIKELNGIGWTADYDLSGGIYDLKPIVNDAKNGTKYEEFSLGGKIDNGYFNNCFLKSIFGV